MIFERSYDDRYYLRFAWLPVRLYGPDEWNRCARLNVKERWIWLTYYWRYRARSGVYRAVPDENTTNKLLIESMRRET